MTKIENKTDKPITMWLKITNAKCIGKKITIESKSFKEISHEVDYIEIVP